MQAAWRWAGCAGTAPLATLTEPPASRPFRYRLAPHPFRTRNDLAEPQQTRSKSNENTAKSTKLVDILPLITVWLQVRVLPGPLSLAKRVKAAAPKPTWAKAGCARELRLGKPRRHLSAKAGARFASYGLASHAAIINGEDSRKADAVLAPNQNIENNPMQSSIVVGWHGCFERILRKHFDTSGKSVAQVEHCAIYKTPMALPNNGLFGAIAGKKSLPTIEVAPAEVAPARHSE